MTRPARNEVNVIAALAPRTIAYLQIPLTPARAARFTDFCARHDLDPQALVLDLIDDMIFDTGFVASGGASCTEQYRGGSEEIAAELPRPVADVPPTTKTGSAQQLGSSTAKTQASRCTSSRNSATSARASDTRPATSSRQHISSADCFDPITVSNGSAPSCPDQMRPGGPIISALAVSRSRSTLCGNED